MVYWNCLRGMNMRFIKLLLLVFFCFASFVVMDADAEVQISTNCLKCGNTTAIYMEDGTSHWTECITCGNTTAKEKHERYCDRDYCWNCLLPYNGYNVLHVYRYEGDENMHWEACTGCEDTRGQISHTRYCDSEFCYLCYMPYSGNNLSHENQKWLGDESGHWAICPDCGGKVYDKSTHWRYCNEENCHECGYASNENEDVIHEEEQYEGDENYHWYLCLLCGYESIKDEHYRSCDISVCVTCYMPYTGNNVGHAGSYKADEDYHWFYCHDCGYEESYKEKHLRWCNEEACYRCGSYYAGDNLMHVNSIYESDGDEHWFSCASCGYESESEMHWRWCDEQECLDCGASYTGDWMIHSNEVFERNENYCKSSCSACGYYTEWEEHCRWCNENSCANCGQIYTGGNIIHGSTTVTGKDENEHWYICMDCGKRDEYHGIMPHTRYCNEERCFICNMSYSGNYIQHYQVTYKGNKDGHYSICTLCDYVSPLLDHYRKCNENICIYCKEECPTSAVCYHANPVYSNSQELISCAACGYTHDKCEHFRYCTDSECAYCREFYEGDNLIHAGTCYGGETISPTCTEDGMSGGYFCSYCKGTIEEPTVIPALGHEEGEWVVVSEATYYAEGLKEKKCTACNAVIETEIIPKLEDNTPKPSVDTVSAKQGEPVTLDLHVNSSDAYMVRFGLSYDETALELVSFTCKEGITESATYSRLKASENALFTVYSSSNNVINGLVGTVTFNILDTAVDGTYTISANIVEAYDFNMNPTTCAAAVDKVKVGSRHPGDVNEDSSVDGRDLLLLARYNAEFPVTINSSNADVDANGIVDGRDLLILARYNAEFPGVYLK